MIDNPSVCIPNNMFLDKKSLYYTFNKFGCVKNIQIYDKKTFVYFNYWFLESSVVKNIVDRLENNLHVNIVYNFPWFWKCYKKRS